MVRDHSKTKKQHYFHKQALAKIPRGLDKFLIYTTYRPNPCYISGNNGTASVLNNSRTVNCNIVLALPLSVRYSPPS